MGGCWTRWVSDEGEGEGGHWRWSAVVDVRGAIDGRGPDSQLMALLRQKDCARGGHPSAGIPNKRSRGAGIAINM